MCYFIFFFSNEWVIENTVSIEILGPKIGSDGDTTVLLATKHPGASGPSMKDAPSREIKQGKW